MASALPAVDTLRKPLFLVAVILIVVVLLVEAAAGAIASLITTFNEGCGVPYIALLDALLVFTITLMAASLLLPERVHGRVQGLATLIVSFFVALGSLIAILVAFIALVIMVTLLMAMPFGPIAYAVLFGHFNRGGASAVLAITMILKLFFAGFLVAAQQRFLQNKGLVLLIAFSLLCTFIVQFLHALVPGVLVSVTDALAGIIVGIIALIWAVWFFLRSIPAIRKAIV